jgi:glutathione S-transferase
LCWLKGLALPAIAEVIGDHFRLRPQAVDKWPHAMVPMLETDEGERIGEAMAICRYPDAIYPEPRLLGTTALEKAVIEMWQRRANGDGLIGCAEIFRNSHPEFIDCGLPGSLEPIPQIPALIERGKGRVRRFYRKFDAQTKDRPWLVGDRFSVADITTLCVADFAKFVGLDIPADCPHYARWYAAAAARPSALASR